jgi:hypothetical protein
LGGLTEVTLYPIRKEHSRSWTITASKPGYCWLCILLVTLA